MEYISTKEAAKKWGITPARIAILASEGRIPGLRRLGRSLLIPASADKPAERKGGRAPSPVPKTDNFSFPLYPYRSDWSKAIEANLSEQQRSLLAAELAVQECRFADAYTDLKTILCAPEDIAAEIGALWNLALCCIGLNKPTEFSGCYLRLHLLLTEDFPHRNDLSLILDTLKTYADTIGSTAGKEFHNTDVHEQCLPLMCVLVGYEHLVREAMQSGTADATLLEINLRFLKSTGAILAAENLHLHLFGIYSFRSNPEAAERHAKAAIKIAYETKYYFPLVTYYRYFSSALSPCLAQYPEDFQEHCRQLFSGYETNFTAAASAMSENSVISKLRDDDLPYVCALLQNLTNAQTARKLGVAQSTVKRRLDKLCYRIGVKDREALKAYLCAFM